MKLIKPITVATAMLASSTVPETDYAAWNSGTAYVVGNRCILASTHRIYECLVNNTNFSPDVNPVKWLDIAPTNRWSMFDDVVGTLTTQAATITQVLNPGAVGGIALLELAGRTATVSLKDIAGGTQVYSKTITLDGSTINSIYDWFFQPYEQLTDLVLTDLPFHYKNPELTVTISATTGSPGVGVCKFGEVIDIGETEYPASVGINDYSRKEKDAFGNYTIVERAFSKWAKFKIQTDTTRFNRIAKALAAVRAKPCVYIGTEVADYEPLIIYGFSTWSIDVAYPTINYCTLEIEGLI